MVLLAPLRLFVYGTLQPGGYYYRQYCHGRTKAERPARVRGFLYELASGYPAAIHGQRWVYGWLLSFVGSDDLWPLLDAVEDYRADRPLEQNEYYRTRVEAFTVWGEESLGEVWTYLMTEQRLAAQRARWLPGGRWSIPAADGEKQNNLQLHLGRGVIPVSACSNASTHLFQGRSDTVTCAISHERANG